MSTPTGYPHHQGLLLLRLQMLFVRAFVVEFARLFQRGPGCGGLAELPQAACGGGPAGDGLVRRGGWGPGSHRAARRAGRAGQPLVRQFKNMFITPLYRQHASHTLASRAYGPQPRMRS